MGLAVSLAMQTGDTEEGRADKPTNSHPLHPGVKVIGDSEPA